MGFTVNQVIPWGRSFDEYLQMFALSEDDLHCSYLDCAGGPASFNAVMTRRGYSVVSCDPLYRFSTAQISDRIQFVLPIVIQQVEANREDYIWHQIKSPEHLAQVRKEAMNEFLADFDQGRQTGRYIDAELPHLPFADRQFDRALSAHFLFSYSDRLSEKFHRDAILELCRVASIVLLFPLVSIGGETPEFFPKLIEQLTALKYSVEIQSVPYHFQKGGNLMMKIISP